VSIFNKRNALVGFVTLKALGRRRRKRQTMKLAAYVALGIVSAGILAALVAVAVRRQRETQDDGKAIADELDGRDLTELDLAMPEPGFAA